MPEPPIEVSAGVHVFTSRREHTTSTLVVSRGTPDAILIDPAWDPDELVAIADFVDGRAVRIEAGFATHAHYDHLLWHPRFGEGPRYASAATAACASARRKKLAAALGEEWPHKLAKLVGRVEPPPSAGLFVGDEPVELITHDAHIAGHTALWFERRRVLLAGDMLSDVELPLPYPDETDGIEAAVDSGPLVAYLAGLDALAPYVARTDVLIPGHGTPTDRPMQRLDADRRHLDALLTAY